MKHLIHISLALSCLALAPVSGAQDGEDPVELREETRCFAASNITGFVKRFDDLDASKRDSVDASIRPAIIINDEGDYPDRLYVQHGEQQDDVAIEGEGRMPTLIPLLKTAHEESEICLEDKARAGTPVSEPGASFNMSFSIRHINTSGTYAMAELEDGLKDGKSFYKKMVGGAMALLVPKMTHVVVAYEDDEANPQIDAYKGEERLGEFNIELFDGGHVIRLKDLKKLGATHLKVSGGEHFVSPAPSIKTMKRFGLGGG